MTGRIKRMLAVTVVAISLFSCFALASSAASTSNVSITFTAGQLTLDSVPAISFGSQVVPVTNTSYNAVSVSPNILVTDGRGGKTGWNVSVVLSNFTDSASNQTLTGSYLTLPIGTVSAVDATNTSTPPTALLATLTSGSVTAKKILSADAATTGEPTGHAQGQWASSLAPASTSLNVMAGSAEASACNATLTWTLADGP